MHIAELGGSDSDTFDLTQHLSLLPLKGMWSLGAICPCLPSALCQEAVSVIPH